MDDYVSKWKGQIADNWTVPALKLTIVVWALFVIILTLFFVDNPWILAGILLYEILP